MRKAREGDQKALDILLARYQPRVMSVVRKRLGPALRSQVESRDVMQDVMVDVLRSIQDFVPKSEGAFYRWISRVVENRLRSSARQQRRRVRVVAEEALPEQPDPEPERALERLQREYEKDLLGRSIEALPPAQARVVRLRNYAGLSFRDIGDILECTEEAACGHYRRAKIRLVVELNRLRKEDDKGGEGE